MEFNEKLDQRSANCDPQSHCLRLPRYFSAKYIFKKEIEKKVFVDKTYN